MQVQELICRFQAVNLLAVVQDKDVILLPAE